MCWHTVLPVTLPLRTRDPTYLRYTAPRPHVFALQFDHKLKVRAPSCSLCVPRSRRLGSDSMTADNTRRWSEVVPPETALSFAAIWDPEDGLVTFSGPELLNADSGSSMRDLPLDANEGRSQILTIDGFSLPFSGVMQDTAGLGRRVQFMANALDEGQSILDPYMRYFEERRRAQGIKPDGDKGRRRIVHWSQLRHASAAMASLGNRILKPFTITPPDNQSQYTYDGLFEEVPVTARTSTSAPMMVHLHLVRGMVLWYQARADPHAS